MVMAQLASIELGLCKHLRLKRSGIDRLLDDDLNGITSGVPAAHELVDTEDLRRGLKGHVEDSIASDH